MRISDWSSDVCSADLPFLFEHAPVRENCLNCHTPHGSNQHALLVAPVPMLCQQCHSHTRHPNDMFNEQMLGNTMSPDERLMVRGCLTCHSQIHGSNNPAGPRFIQYAGTAKRKYTRKNVLPLSLLSPALLLAAPAPRAPDT